MINESNSENKHYLVSDNEIENRPYDEQQYRDFLEGHNGEYETVLWSGTNENEPGGADFARGICKEHNANLSEGEKPWMTNEMLLEEAGMTNEMGQLNDVPEYTDDKNPSQDIEAGACWDSASRATCDNASGEIHAVLGVKGNEGSVYNNVEREALSRNDNVNNVDVITNDKTGIDETTGKFDEHKAIHANYEHDNLPITSSNIQSAETTGDTRSPPTQTAPNEEPDTMAERNSFKLADQEAPTPTEKETDVKSEAINKTSSIDLEM